MAWPDCDVCGQPAKGVASSTLGAIGFAYCQACLDRGAEPLWMWEATIDLCGGPDGVRDDLIETAASWVDGEYVGWGHIAARATDGGRP